MAFSQGSGSKPPSKHSTEAQHEWQGAPGRCRAAARVPKRRSGSEEGRSGPRNGPERDNKPTGAPLQCLEPKHAWSSGASSGDLEAAKNI